MSPNGVSRGPSLVPPQPNTPQEIQEAIEATRDLREEMKRIFPILNPDYRSGVRGRIEGDGSIRLGPGARSMEVETPNGPIEIFMASEDALNVKNENEKLAFVFEGDYIRLDHNTEGGRNVIYEYNPLEEPPKVSGSASLYTECVRTFLEFMRGIR